MLGIFHMIMVYLGIIDKKILDAGLIDLIVQSDVVATGSVDKALSDNMYNRSIRADKIVYEAVCRCLLNRMEDNNTEDHELAVIQKFIKNFKKGISQLDYERQIHSEDVNLTE